MTERETNDRSVAAERQPAGSSRLTGFKQRSSDQTCRNRGDGAQTAGLRGESRSTTVSGQKQEKSAPTVRLIR